MQTFSISQIKITRILVRLQEKIAKLGVKNILFTSTSKILPGATYAKYLVFLNRAYCYLSRSKTIINIYSEPSIHLGPILVQLWRVTDAESEIVTPSAHRLSRFMKGFSHSSLKQWERYGIDKLLDGSKPEVVFDVGANIGEFSNACLLHGFPNVHSFEPDPVAFYCLDQNLSSRALTLNNFALGESDGEFTFYASPMDADSSLIKPSAESHQIKAQVRTIDKYIEEFKIKGPILLKMDAEGAEPEVLRGILRSIENFKWMAIDVGPENQGKDTILEVTSILNDLGFKVMHYENWVLHARK